MSANTIDLNKIRHTSDKERSKNVKEVLRAMAGDTANADSVISYHEAPPHKISIPEGMSVSRLAKIAAEAAEAEQETQRFTRKYRFRPNDGAVALHRVMKNLFGSAGRGLEQRSFFGSTPPQMIDVSISHTESISVPWGTIAFEPLEATIITDATVDPIYGALFVLHIDAKKKDATVINQFFKLIEEELTNNSIYKGKFIKGTQTPEFLPTTVDNSIVYNKATEAQIDSYIEGVLRHSDLLKESEIKIDPKVLLYGTFGTGKSELLRRIALAATKKGWTCVQTEAGKSTIADLESAVQTARLLAPAVLMVEDIDAYMDDHDERERSRMLELFDGVTSKGQEVMILMTTNHPDRIGKGMQRAGRINKMVEIGLLDREATERLIRTVCGDMLGEVDFDKVYEAIKDYEPSFVRQTFDDAKQSALIAHADKLEEAGTLTSETAKRFVLNTEDFVNAANVMRAQHASFTNKKDADPKPRFEEQIVQVLIEALGSDRVSMYNDQIGDIEVTVQA